jgi:hypothetical protein
MTPRGCVRWVIGLAGGRVVAIAARRDRGRPDGHQTAEPVAPSACAATGQ